MLVLLLVAGICLVLLKALSAQSQRDKLAKELREVKVEADKNFQNSLDYFRKTELAIAKDQALQFAQLEFDHWKADYTCKERADAVKKSRAVNRGLVSEQLAPHLAGFAYNPKDAHFLGNPVDYVIFNGLDSGLLKEIVLVDIKTGEAKLNARQVQVKNIVSEKKIRFETFRPEIQ
jgi:predicted Holliday junction resolvase-like endonuclease